MTDEWNDRPTDQPTDMCNALYYIANVNTGTVHIKSLTFRLHSLCVCLYLYIIDTKSTQSYFPYSIYSACQGRSLRISVIYGDGKHDWT